MIDSERQVVFRREVSIRARAQVCRARSIRSDRLRARLSLVSERCLTGTFEFKSFEQQNQAFAKRTVVSDSVSDMRPSDVLGFFAAKPKKDGKYPAISRPVAEREVKFCVKQERADFKTGCLCKSLPKRSLEEGIAICRLPDQVFRYCS